MVTHEHLDRISTLLASAPAWARLALTSPDPRLRARGADEVTAFLLRRMEAQGTERDENQLTLPISC